MTHDEAVKKAAKLLRLAKSDNPNEAALAAARAQEIIERYKLTGVSADINTESAAEPDEPIKDFAEPLSGDRTHPTSTWKVRLALGIAEVNQCRIYYGRFPDGKKTMMMIGRASDAQTVRYMYEYLMREVDRLSRRDGKGFSQEWGNNFRLGAVDTIVDRLQESRNATRQVVRAEATSSSAIVRIDTALARMKKQDEELAAFMHNKFGGKTRRLSERGAADYGARAAGQKAGKEVNLSSGRPLGSGQKKLA